MMENFGKIDMNDLMEAPYNGEPLRKISTVKSEKFVAVLETGEDTGHRTLGLPKKSENDFPRLRRAEKRKLKKQQKISEGTWLPNKPCKDDPPKAIGGFRRSIAPDYSHSRRTLRGVSSRGRIGRGDPVRRSSGGVGRTKDIINYRHPMVSSAASTSRSEVSYKKPADIGIRMAVIHKMHPDVTLDRDQGDLIKAKLEELVDGLPVGGPSLQFNSTRFQRGVFWLTCANETTKDWLVETVAGLENLWEGGGLIAVLEKDMPKRQKVVVWVAGSSAEEDAVRARLTVQNPSLNTDNWKPLNRKVMEKGQLITFSIDERSFEALKEWDFRPFWGLGKLKFKIAKS